MPGLFDMLAGNLGADDPQRAAYLALAAGLMSGKGSFGQVFGNAQMGAQEAFQNVRKAQLQAQQAQQQAMMTKMQMEEIQRKAKLDAERPERIREAVASFPQAGIVAGPPEEGGAYPTRIPGEQDYMKWAMNSYGLDPNLSQFGWKAAEGMASREDKQVEARERQSAALKAAMEKAAADNAARLERQREAAQSKSDLAQILAANRPPRSEPAPTLTTLADPTDPEGKKQLVVDARAYRGGGMGSPGVIGASGKEGGEKLRQIPALVNTAILENKMGQDRLNRAITLLEGKDIKAGKESRIGDTSATGWKGFLPDPILTRVDPKGVDARAEVADIGSLKIHDRSGAAVPISESPRLMPFIPKSTDDNSTALKKLRRLKTEMNQAGMAMAEIYSEDQGYRSNPISKKGSGQWTIEVEK